MNKKLIFDWDEYKSLAREAGAEGCVLIKNDKEALPLKKGGHVALYGRTQFDYIKSGSGSGGMVNVPYTVNITEGLENAGVCLDENVKKRYTDWLKENPFDRGVGWAGEPFSQVEMELKESDVAADAKNNDTAIFVIGRLAGEDKDNVGEPGSYLLRDDERKALEILSKHFEKLIVVINSGNIIDMKWVREYNPAGVLYVWQGGIEGGNAAADVLTGKINPSGRLSDTIAYDLSDYPCYGNFGDRFKNVYAEDIYVGYRYFETFNQDKVLYPFGYGLSYTTFKHEGGISFDGETVTCNVTVTNTGNVPGKDAVLIYVHKPDGSLKKPVRELVDFEKSKLLNPGESDEVTISFSVKALSSYDDTGVTGFENSWVLEEGSYELYEGGNVRLASLIGAVSLSETVLAEATTDALSPTESFERMVNIGGKISYETVPVRKYDTEHWILKERKKLKEIPYAGKQSYTLKDVRDGKIDMDTFIGGLSDIDMIHMTRGEGMCSPKVTPGTAAAFAGVTEELISYGIPSVCCSDGPSGMRLDVGTKAFQGPNGVCLACSFNKNLVSDFYEYMGKEMRMNKVDSLLGPGMNIHRSPLNGRNFEYFSEDPVLTGKMAAAELKGFHKSKVTGTIKHFSCNNQEVGRNEGNSVVSKRALREIYLKGFEIAVKEGGAYNIMTSYGILNGTHTSASFEQNIMVVRDDWKYDGLLETDWWTTISEEGGEATRKKTSFMIRGGNDIYMVTSDVVRNDNDDDSEEGLKNGIFTRAELQRNVRHILTAAMKTRAFARACGETEEWEVLNAPKDESVERINEFTVVAGEGSTVDESLIDTHKGVLNRLFINLTEKKKFLLRFDVRANGSLNAQIPMTLSINGIPKKIISKKGTDNEFTTEELDLESSMSINLYLGILFGQDGMEIKNIHFVKQQ